MSEARKRDYQPLHLILITGSFWLLGPSEWSARLYPVLAGTLGIYFAYLFAKEVSDENGGLLAAFLVAFSQLNLSNSTQSKQYIAIQACLLLVLFFVTKLTTKKRTNEWVHHFLVILTATIATLLHFLGILVFIPYFIYLALSRHSYFSRLLKRPLVIFLVFAAGFGISYLINLPLILRIFWTGKSLEQIFFPYNHGLYFLQLFAKNYWLFALSAFLGWLFSLRTKPTLSLVVAGYVFVSLYLWTFKHYTHNVRYIVPLFGIIFVYTAVFWQSLCYRIFKGNYFLPLVIFLLLLGLLEYKVVLWPKKYYNPNADIYGDVQIANYRDLFQQIKTQYPGYRKLAIFNDIPFAQNWYLPEKKATAYFSKFTPEPYRSTVDGIMVYGSLSDFKHQLQQHPRGVIIVEDWQSFLPDTIKNYVKSNLKLEFRVDSIALAANDPWPLAVYSWRHD